MYLRFVKQLERGIGQKLLEAKHQVDKLNTTVDPVFLWDDLYKSENNIYNYLKIINPAQYASKYLIDEKIGGYKNSKYHLETLPDGNVSFSDILGAYTSKGLSFMVKVELDNASPSIALHIYELGIKSIDNFSWKIENNMTSKKSLTNRKLDFRRLVVYFAEKRTAYERIHDILLEKKNIMEPVLGEELSSDLISMFSVKETKMQEYRVSKENLEKELIIHENGMGSLTPKGCTFLGDLRYEDYSKIQAISFFVNANDQLHMLMNLSDYALYKDYPILTDKNIFELKNDRKFEDKINIIASDWLKNYKYFSDFNQGLYENLKSKILINQL